MKAPLIWWLSAAGMVLLGSSCSSGTVGSCSVDDDCPAGQDCLFDVDRDITYCARTDCNTNDDCPRFQFCTDTGACIDRVRSCEPDGERLNGLDDDCDGVVDEEGAPVVNCVTDRVCGAFVCGAPAGQPQPLCLPPNEGKPSFGTCTTDDDCENEICVTGFCSPICSSSTFGCPAINIPGATSQNPREAFCLRAVGQGSDNRTRFNQCQPSCFSPNQCPDPFICAWRDAANQDPLFDADHAFVCTLPDPSRKGLGDACSGNSRLGDDECSYGLCLGPLTGGQGGPECTRICAGAGGDCSDVGPDYECVERDLFYGGEIFRASICSRGP